MFALHCVKQLSTLDGRLFLPGHTSYQLFRDEAAALIKRYPDHFEPADPITLALAEEVLGTTVKMGAAAMASLPQRWSTAERRRGSAWRISATRYPRRSASG